MKILFFTRLFWPHVGGVEKHISEISKRLIKKGYKITLLTTKYQSNLYTSELVHGINVHRFRHPKIKYLGLLYSWFWLFKNIDLIKQSDIIHIHDVFIWYWPFRIIFPSKKVYVTYHGRWGRYPIPLNDLLQKKIGAILSSGVISIGDYIHKNYGIKSDIISYGATDIPSKSLGKNEKLIVYVGRLDKDIGLMTLINAYKYYDDSNHHSNIKIEFCGDGELANECKKYGKVHGFVDPSPFYQKAKYCFASGYLTILEALANKCLVFTAYDNPLQKDYYQLVPFKKYINISSNPVKLSQTLIGLSKNEKRANTLIKNGYNWVKTQTWEKLTQDYLKLWKSEEK